MGDKKYQNIGLNFDADFSFFGIILWVVLPFRNNGIDGNPFDGFYFKIEKGTTQIF